MQKGVPESPNVPVPPNNPYPVPDSLAYDANSGSTFGITLNVSGGIPQTPVFITQATQGRIADLGPVAPGPPRWPPAS